MIEATPEPFYGEHLSMNNRSSSVTSLVGQAGLALMLLACAGGLPQPGAAPASAVQPLAPKASSADTVKPAEAAKPAEATQPAEAEVMPSFEGVVEAAPVSAEGQWILSRRYWKGVGVRQTRGLAYLLARRAASNGSSLALDWLKSRADSDVFARLHLGLLLTNGPAALSNKPNGEPLIREAVAGLEALAAKGDAEALDLLGECYLRGLGTAKDPAKALTLFERAAAAGEAEALNSLGDLYYEGDGVPKDLAKAADLYRRAAEAGSGFGQSNYGYVLDRGQGVKADAAGARKWYRMSAERGAPNAQRNLALLLLEGDPSQATTREAVGWFMRAADQNNAGALLDLAHLYAEGKRVAKDMARAKELASRSAQLGHEPAKQWLVKLAVREKCEPTAETKLFDVAVACADREVLRRAIVTSGGKAQREDDRYWYDVYDSAGLLVDSVKLSVGYTTAGDFATAQYDFGDGVGLDELDRTIELLVPKYGVPKITKTINHNLAKWTRKDGIVIELERTPINMYLRYIHPKRLKLLEQEMAADKGAQRRREIAKQSHAF